ncbi:putative Ig domain-containing protein [Comamonas sp. JC664]
MTTQPGTSAVSGASYTYALKAVDADGDTLVYALTEFPQGMLIDSSTGANQWSVPANVAGLAPVMVEVTDGKGGIATRLRHLGLGASNRAPAFSSTPVTSATAGSAYAYTARATDPDGDAISYTLVSAPAGMAIHATSGAISWTPTLAQGGTMQ